MALENIPVGVRLQKLGYVEQALVLARLAQARYGGRFTPTQLAGLFTDCSLPAPKNISATVAKLSSKGLLAKGVEAGSWRIAPLGLHTSLKILSDLDLAAFSSESISNSSALGQVAHTVIPPAFAPTTLIAGLRAFLNKHPFETNVFGMTRFPDSAEKKPAKDPVGPALDVARKTCALHGLQFHLASDRAINDDLWTNTTAHMWASQYGIGFFEDRRQEGLNYNLTIEVGSMLITGRRCALLKDRSIPKMPTDLVGKIYKGVDFDKLETISQALHEWIRDDLNLGACPQCPSKPA